MRAVNLPYPFSKLTLPFFDMRSQLTPSFFNVRRVDLLYPFCARGRELPYLSPGVTLSFLTSSAVVAAVGVLCRRDIYCLTENSTGYRAVCGT